MPRATCWEENDLTPRPCYSTNTCARIPSSVSNAFAVLARIGRARTTDFTVWSGRTARTYAFVASQRSLDTLPVVPARIWKARVWRRTRFDNSARHSAKPLQTNAGSRSVRVGDTLPSWVALSELRVTHRRQRRHSIYITRHTKNSNGTLTTKSSNRIS